MIKASKILTLLLTIVLVTSCENTDFNGGGSISDSSNNDSEKAGTSSFSAISFWPSEAISNTGLQLKFSDQILELYNEDTTQISSILDEWNNAAQGRRLLSSSIQQINNFEPLELQDYGSDNIFGVYLSNDWFSDQDRFALAITQYFGIRNQSGNLELVHGDIIVNNSGDFEFFTDLSRGAPDAYDLSSILIHEIGHFLGLGHQRFSSSSIMRPTLRPFSLERQLYELDTESIEELYPRTSNAVNSIIAAKMSSSPTERERKVVRGVIKLMANGDCEHFEDGKLVHKH